MRRWLIAFLLLAELPVSAKVKRGATNEVSRTTQNQTIILPGTVFASGRYTYSWPRARSCVASPNWNPMPAVSGGPNADMPLSATNTTYQCGQSTDSVDPNDLFGHDSGLLAGGIGTLRVNDAWTSAATACWLDATPTGFAAIPEGTNFLIRVVFQATTTAGTKNVWFFNTSAAEYIRLAMGTAMTFTLREGASGNQTMSWTPGLQLFHIMDFLYVSDCNGDSGNPCAYLYSDGQAPTVAGNFAPNGTELGVNMAQFDAATSVALMCDAVEAGMFNGKMIFVGMSVGATASWFGANPTQYLAQHRQDCQDLGICSILTTIENDHFGQSLTMGFNGSGTTGVVVTAGTAVATIASAWRPHGIRVGDRITTTGLTTNDANVTVSAVAADTVSYPTAAAPGTMADGVGTVTLNAHSRTQTRNFRECRNTGTLPLLVEGTSGSGGEYESPLYATADELVATHGRGEQFVAVERGISDTSILELNQDTTDGTSATTNYDTFITWITDCETRVGGQGSTITRHVVNYDQGEGSGDAPGLDYRRSEWSELFAGLQESLDTSIKAVSGQSQEVTMCFNQTNSWTNAPLANGTIAQEQLIAHEVLNNGSRAFLTGPKYQCRYSDGTHLTGEGYTNCSACLFARCENAVLNGTAWSPTRPTAQTISSNTINVAIYTPTPPLVVDTTNVTDPSGGSNRRGFEYIDTDPSAADPTISSVDCSAACAGNTCTCAVAMSGSPDREGARIRYAYAGTGGQPAGPTTGARGNIRDSYGNGSASSCSNQSNWLVAFDKPVTRTFVDDYAWDFNNTQEECDATDGAGQEAPNGLGQTATSLVVDVWVKPTAGQLADRQVVGKSNNTTVGWGLTTQTSGTGYALRFLVGANTQWVQFGNDLCNSGNGQDNCTETAVTTPLTNGQWAHAIVSSVLARGTFATTAVTCTANLCTASIASVPSYIVAGQQAVTSGHTTNTPSSGGTISSVTGTTIVYALTVADGPMADGVGSLTVNDSKVKAFVAQCDSGTPPTCGTLNEVQVITNGEMPASFTDTAQPLRVGGWGSGVNNVGYMGGRIGEIAINYADQIDSTGSTQTHRSYNVTDVRACRQTASTNKPVDLAQMSGTVYQDGSIYRSCDWPQLRARYRMGDMSSGTTLENHTWETLPSGVSGSLTCTNNTGSDIISDSID